ncbi:phosphopantetheine-binding protein [Streptomyces sp. SCA3-4]|uniref:acyl carrier protein n=1 Tax=Streptomyces sichuanensis TaxID=2871810 RepID=UPI001CE259AF|nr:phosphopantetheine-binding protein [Streptomyces sichuanensis]MCA6094676.1 phosphopantetheine-binding protein [Streptomyces sichuanensis]
MTITQTDSAGPLASLDKEDLRATVAHVLDIDTEELADDAGFIEDLGVDSLVALEVVVVLEKKYAVRLGEDELRRITTLDNAHQVLLGKLSPA